MSEEDLSDHIYILQSPLGVRISRGSCAEPLLLDIQITHCVTQSGFKVFQCLLILYLCLDLFISQIFKCFIHSMILN